MELFVQQNDVFNVSHKLPGLIVQSYLVLVELFNLDPMEPLQRVKVEEVECIGDSENVEMSEIGTFDECDNFAVFNSDLDSDNQTDTSVPPKRKRVGVRTAKSSALTKKDAYECPTCDKTYAQHRFLKKHIIRVHGEKKFQCMLCPKAYSIQGR